MWRRLVFRLHYGCQVYKWNVKEEIESERIWPCSRVLRPVNKIQESLMAVPALPPFTPVLLSLRSCCIAPWTAWWSQCTWRNVWALRDGWVVSLVNRLPFTGFWSVSTDGASGLGTPRGSDERTWSHLSCMLYIWGSLFSLFDAGTCNVVCVPCRAGTTSCSALKSWKYFKDVDKWQVISIT